MDKKNTTIGIMLLAAAFGLMLLAPRTSPPPAASPIPVEGAHAPSGGVESVPPGVSIGPGPAAASGSAANPEQPVALQSQAPHPSTMFAPLAPAPRGDEQFTTLHNEFIEARFTNYGGAIAEIALMKHRARQDATHDPLVLNANRHAPLLAFARWPGADMQTAFERISTTPQQVVFRAVMNGQLEIVRTYTISTNPAVQDPYVIRHETTLRNLASGPITGGRLALNLGTARMVHDTDDGRLLQVGRFDGDKLRLTPRGALQESSGFLGFGGHPSYPYLENIGPTMWATVENQFFATIVSPKTPGSGLLVRRVELSSPYVPGARPNHGLTTDLYLDTGTIPAGGSASLSFDVYAGPKEFNRLERLGQDQDEVMQWGMFGFFAKLLLTLMNWVHGLFEGSAWAWGWAIIGTTVIIRTLMWPLTGMSTRAAKRMAKISAPLKELQEKYKDNKQKLTEETMKLWKEHKVNPVAGCLPILLQMPIFFGLFTMLRSASELRFAEFLWTKDLSAPDTVAVIPLGFFDLPVNPMPILMGITSMVQMRMTPTPTTDNPTAKMMKFMPIMFTVLCYGFSAGLAVYWTFSNIFSIFQQWVTNRQKDPVAVVPPKPGAADRAKPVKDAKVTNVRGPKKKK